MTATVIEPAGPALTTWVRLPGFVGAPLVEGTDVDGIDVDGMLVVGETLVVGTLVVGATDVEGTLVLGLTDVDGLEEVDGLVEVDGLEDVLGDTDVTVGSTVVADSAPDSNGDVAETAAVTPIQSPTAATAITALRRYMLGASF